MSWVRSHCPAGAGAQGRCLSDWGGITLRAPRHTVLQALISIAFKSHPFFTCGNATFCKDSISHPSEQLGRSEPFTIQTKMLSLRKQAAFPRPMRTGPRAKCFSPCCKSFRNVRGKQRGRAEWGKRTHTDGLCRHLHHFLHLRSSVLKKDLRIWHSGMHFGGHGGDELTTGLMIIKVFANLKDSVKNIYFKWLSMLSSCDANGSQSGLGPYVGRGA